MIENVNTAAAMEAMPRRRSRVEEDVLMDLRSDNAPA
jgi:hypothetical protein